MNTYCKCVEYLRNGFTKCLCAMITCDLKSDAFNNSQFLNEFDIPGSQSFNERWHKKLQVDELKQNASESEKQLVFLIHLIILYNLYDIWQSIVKIAETIITSKESTIYNPVLLQWILTTRPKLVEAILSYPAIQLSYNYQCSRCLYKAILDILLSVDEVQLNNLFREFPNQYGCIDYLLLESVHNLSDRITMCIQKIDVYRLHLRNITRLKLPNDQDVEIINSPLKTSGHLDLADSNTLNLRHTLSRWRAILMKKLISGHNFERRLTYYSEKLHCLLLSLKSAKEMETYDYVEIEKRLSHSQVIMDQVNKLLHDLQTIPFQTSINHSINFINLINQLLVLRQQNIVQHILNNRLKYYLSELQNYSTIYQRLLHLFQLGKEDCKQIMKELICVLNFKGLPNSFNYHIDMNNKFIDYQHLEEPLFRRNVKSPGLGGLEQLFCKLSMVDKYCTEAQRYLGQSCSLFPLNSTSPNDYEQMNDFGGSESYLNRLTHELVMSILSPSVVKRKIQCLTEKSEKLRNILSAFEDNANEMNAFRDQLCLAIPQLTGYHLSNLIKAVDQLEISANKNLNESCLTDPVEKRHPELGIYLKHAGQRLMELETCLEHSREAASILIYFECESQFFWSTKLPSLPSKTSEVSLERGLLFQSHFKTSPVAAKLHTAWMKLTQLGDRLGRIQAGLPVRPTEANGVERCETYYSPSLLRCLQASVPNNHCEIPLSSPQMHHRFSTVLQSHLSSTQTQPNMSDEQRTKLMKIDRKRINCWKNDDLNVFTTEFPYVSADKLRRKQTNLRDALGSHMCVHPDCKTSSGKCMSIHTVHNENQLNIENKIEWIFKKLVNLHTYLQNDYNESFNCEELQRQTISISMSELCDLVRYARRLRWHKSHSLQSEYQELKSLIDELANSEHPKVAILQEYFQSLEDLWFGMQKSQVKLSDCTNEASSYSRLSIPRNVPGQHSVKSDNTELQGNNIDSKQYTPGDTSSHYQPFSVHSTTSTTISYNPISMSQDYTTHFIQGVNDKPSNNDLQLVKKQIDSSYADEHCDWTWREMTTHRLGPQPLVFPSSANANHIFQTVNLKKAYDPTTSVDLQLKNETTKYSDAIIDKMISELSSTTSSFQKISSDMNGTNSGTIFVEKESTLAVDNKTLSSIHNHGIKVLPNNNLESDNRLLKVISPSVNHRNSVLRFNKVCIEVPLLPNDVKKNFKVKSQSAEINSHSGLTNSMTDIVQTNSCMSALTLSSQHEHCIDAFHKPDGVVTSNSRISHSTIDHIKFKPVNICFDDKASIELLPNKLLSSQIHVNTNTLDSLGESIANEQKKGIINKFSPNTTLDVSEKHEFIGNNYILSDRQLQISSPNITPTTIYNINRQSDFHDVSTNDSVFPTSIMTPTATTIKINLTEHTLKFGQKENRPETKESCLTTSLHRIDQSCESCSPIIQASSVPLCLHSSSTKRDLNARKIFNEIYQCHHLDSSFIFHEGNNVNANHNNINSMCGLCNHMSNLHTLISNLQSHLLSNRQNRLSNLLPIDVESFTLTSSSISSLSSYWSPIIKEYLSILCEIKSELNSFQSLHSVTEYRIIHLPEYKSMIDLLNIWDCRLHDFLCLRSSDSSKPGVDIPQTRWLTLFITIIQHNEIQVEYLKTVFTSLLHGIENEDYESVKCNINTDDTSDRSSCLSQIIRYEDNSHCSRRDPTERFAKSSKTEYLNDLKSRLFSHDFDDQQTISLSLEQPASVQPLVTFSREKTSHSFQTKMTKVDNEHKPFTVFNTISIHRQTHEDKEQTSRQSNSFDKMSFEQYLHSLSQNNSCKIVNGIDSVDKTFTQKAIQETKNSEFKKGTTRANQITIGKSKMKKTRKRKFKNEEFSEKKYNSGDINLKDTCDNIVNNQPCDITCISRTVDNSVLSDQMLKNETDIDVVNDSDKHRNTPVYSSSPISNVTKPYNDNRILPQESDEMKNAVIQNNEVISYWSSNDDNQMTGLSNESTEINDLANINDTVKRGDDLEVKLKSDETVSHPNKSDNLSLNITLHSNNSTLMRDSNTVNGQSDRHSVSDILKGSYCDDQQMSIRFARPNTRLLREINKSCSTNTCSNPFSPKITSFSVETCPALKSEQDEETNKTSKRIWMDNPASTSFESAKSMVTRRTNRDQNHSFNMNSKVRTDQCSKSTETMKNNNDKVENYTKKISQNISSKGKWISPHMDFDRHDEFTNDYESLDKFASTNKKSRKANRKIVKSHRNKCTLINNLELNSEINKSPANCPESHPESLTDKQFNICLQPKCNSKLDSDATSRSASTREISTTRIPTTISLKSGFFEKHQTIPSYKETQLDCTDQNIFHTSDHQQSNHRPDIGSLSISTTLIDCETLYDRNAENCSTTEHSSVTSVEYTKRKTDAPVRLESTHTDNDDSCLFGNKFDTEATEQSKLSLTDLSYQMKYLNNSSTDIQQEIQKSESSVNNLNTNNQYNENDIFKKNFINQSEYVYHTGNDKNMDKSNYDQHLMYHQYHDKHSPQHNFSEHTKHQQAYKSENIHVLRKSLMINQHENLGKIPTYSKRSNNSIHDRVNSLPNIFNCERLTNDSFITNENCLKCKREQVMSKNMTREADLHRREVITRKNQSQRRQCRSLPYLLFLPPLIFLFLLSLLCIFILPDCPLFQLWFRCNEKHPNGEWIYSPFVLFNVRDPPI
ncbi:unnamed protein product [Schistosoma turkestanicum]|nr:unnamed protein product [Schistosoma turkestanicum]